MGTKPLADDIPARKNRAPWKGALVQWELKITHPATVAPAGSNRSVGCRKRQPAKPSMQKVRQGRISEQLDHNENEHRASLEKGNVDAESVILR
jgi:hypothetical protein